MLSVDPPTLGLQEQSLWRKRMHVRPALLSVQHPRPTFAESIYPETSPVFMAVVSSWHWDLTVLVLLLYTEKFWISSILKEHIPRRIMIYLTILVMRPVSCDEWIRAIKKPWCVLEMRIPGGIKQCLLFVPLTGHLTIRSCSGTFLSVYFSFFSKWVHGGQELCFNH